MTGTGPRAGLEVWNLAAARPLLAAFNAAGALAAADVHVAHRLGVLTGERDERVLLAAAVAVAAVRTGSVCTTLEDAPAVVEAAMPVDRPTADGPVAGDSAGGSVEKVTGRSDGEADGQSAGESAGASAGASALPWPAVDEWRAAVLASPMVAVGLDGPADRPVRWVDGRIYLDRYWRHEQTVRAEVDARLGTAADLRSQAPVDLAATVHRMFPEAGQDRQRLAAAAAVLSRFAVLTGGPGTGKTTTVARIVAVLQAVSGPGLRVALAAPTGKAATRLQEAVNAELARLPAEDRARTGVLRAGTIHRLLKPQPGSSTRFRHNREHRLAHDVVVVDESSMVSLPLMARLLEALRPQARLLLVGDPDQLASVEAGAVLGDLVAWSPDPRPTGPEAGATEAGATVADVLARVLPGDVARLGSDDLVSLRHGVVRLTRTHRYGGSLATLAEAIRRADDESVMTLLRSGDPVIEFVETADDRPGGDSAALRHELEATGTALVEAARSGDARGALEALNRHRLLLAHRTGPAGVDLWAARAWSWVAAATGTDPTAARPAGLPLLVTENDPATGLSNGDTGVVVRARPGVGSGINTGINTGAGADDLLVVFGEPDAIRPVRPHRLPKVQPVHAMTVHRAQGSQFTRVSVILPPSSSPLLTRELLYTAVTRAREGVRILGSEPAIRLAVRRPIRRASGLRYPAQGSPPHAVQV